MTPVSHSHFKRPTKLEVMHRVDIGQRVAIALIALSLGLTSLALGIAFIKSPAPLLVLAPAAALQGLPSTATAVTLTWTAPEDSTDSASERSYDLRYADFPITTVNFTEGIKASGVGAPQPAGTTETFTITGLQPNTTYSFALRTQDRAGNVSALLHMSTKTTARLADGCLPKYECSAWSVCVSEHQSRSCGVTNGCLNDLGQPMTEQLCTSQAIMGTARSRGQVRNPVLVAGVGPGVAPTVRVFDPRTQKLQREILAFSPRNMNGTSVAAGDINGDGNADILVGSGAGSDSLVKLFDLNGKVITEFRPYPTSQKSGVAIAVDDVNGDGVDELLTLPAQGAAQLRIFYYDVTAQRFEPLAQGLIFPQENRNGFTLATGDLNLDGWADIVVAPRTNGRTVRVVSLSDAQFLETVSDFQPYRSTFKTGLTVTVADSNGDGRGEIVTAPGPGYAAHVKVFTLPDHLQAEFHPASSAFRGGIDLAAYDIDADGQEEIVVGPYASGEPTVQVFSYDRLTGKFGPSQSFSAYARTMKFGLRLNAAPRI